MSCIVNKSMWVSKDKDQTISVESWNKILKMNIQFDNDETIPMCESVDFIDDPSKLKTKERRKAIKVLWGPVLN